VRRKLLKPSEARHYILYVADGEIFQCGPFESWAGALVWCSDHEGPEGEFDIRDQHAYHQTPDGSLIELSAADIGR
jgi:hypothetical protein